MKQKQQNTPTSSRTDWPPLQLRNSGNFLELEECLQGQIVLIRRLLRPSVCRQYVKFLATLPLTTTPAGRPKAGMAARVNDRFEVQDACFANRLWEETGLREVIQEADARGSGGSTDWGGQPCGLNPRIRIYRYSAGQFFSPHYDESNTIEIPSDRSKNVKAKTTWTLLIYLSSPITGCHGGQTVFYPEQEQTPKNGRNVGRPEPIVIDLEEGLALLHKHGDDCLLHEGRPVEKGEKWIIRSDICVPI